MPSAKKSHNNNNKKCAKEISPGVVTSKKKITIDSFMFVSSEKIKLLHFFPFTKIELGIFYPKRTLSR